jgi:hypothetical protein
MSDYIFFGKIESNKAGENERRFLNSGIFLAFSRTGIPTTIRSLKRKGLRLEKGEILERDYTGPVLEKVLETNQVAHEVPTEGTYKGKHVVVAPIRSKDGNVVAALGIVDILTTIDLPAVFQEYVFVMEEVESAKK